MFLTGIDVISSSKSADQHSCHVRFMVYDDEGTNYLYIIIYNTILFIVTGEYTKIIKEKRKDKAMI